MHLISTKTQCNFRSLCFLFENSVICLCTVQCSILYSQYSNFYHLHLFFPFGRFFFRLLRSHFSPHVKESKRVADSGFHIVDSGFRGLDSGFHAYGFRIPNFLRFRIPTFLTLAFIRSSEANIFQFEYEVVNLNRKFICSPKDQSLF